MFTPVRVVDVNNALLALVIFALRAYGSKERMVLEVIDVSKC
jgi:hypothetical protein